MLTRNPIAIASAADYRADIDGLRAVAVLPVVLFHAEVPGFAGGFVGVDVFFVISGYLITQVLMRAGATPARAVLANFYLRRARRILPALVVMLAVVAAAALVLLLPADLERFGMFLALASAFLGNVAAWLGGGYFDTSGASLLHLWSIGIEEQFYLLYPLIFLAWLRRARRADSWVLGVAAAGSFALWVWASVTHPVVNFYAPVTRAWELLGGGTLALTGWRGFAARPLNEIAAGIAFVALAACVPLFHDGMRRPGPATLIPCAATALLLATGARGGTLAARLLQSRALVFTGLISYSLYLWHAPILSMVRYFLIHAPSPGLLAWELGAIYAISAASWRWVERPVRARARFHSNRGFVLIFAAVSVGLCALGAWMVAGAGLPGRFDPDLRRISFMTHDLGLDASRCFTIPLDRVAVGDVCAFGSPDPRRPAVLVWGDSHAGALLPAYRALATRYDLRLFIATRSGCRPLLAQSTSSPVRSEDCRHFNAAMLNAIDRIEPSVVVLNAFWNLPEFLAGGAGRASGTALQDFARASEAAVARAAARGRRVCVVLDVPAYSEIVPYVLGMTQRRGLSADFLLMTRQEALMQSAAVDEVFRALERRRMLEVVDPKAVLCPDDRCRVLSGDGWPLYNDANHVSPRGAHLLEPLLARCVAGDRGPDIMRR